MSWPGIGPSIRTPAAPPAAIHPDSNRPDSHSGLRQLRRRQAIGLLWIALLVLLFSAWRAGLHAVFLPRWWHVW